MNEAPANKADTPEKMGNLASYHAELQNACVQITFSGAWRKTNNAPSLEPALRYIKDPKAKSISLHVQDLEAWDTSFIIPLVTLTVKAKEYNLPIDTNDIPEGAQKLMTLALTVPPNSEAARTKETTTILAAIGKKTLATPKITRELFHFVGSLTLSLQSFIRGKSSCRWQDIFLHIQECGAEALPIVSLISLLVGAIMAFVGIMQLQMFGATIYVASLVAISMTRIMGAIMTGIIMAGRTGAAYAATLGTMQANEEIDALNTLGITPYDFLILPRVIALTLMTPLLVLYADFMGILGGAFVSLTVLHLDPLEYYTYTKDGFRMANVWVGIVHGFAFGIIISMTGCYQGLKCGRNAAAVGESTTAAVVYAIVGIVIATAVLTALFTILDI